MSKENTSKKTNSKDTEYEEEETGRGGNIVQIILISAMVIIIGAVVVMLLRWQKGIDLVITEDDLTENYDIESEDFYSVFNPNNIEGYIDDNELNIVIMGDRTIYNYNDETGIPAIIAEKTGANVTTLALPDSSIALSKASFALDSATDAFNFYYLGLCMTGGYELQDSALNYIDENEIYSDYLSKIREINFDKVDILILSYGLNDYLNGTRMTGDEVYSGQPYGTMDSVCGSLDSALETLHNRFPYMQIILSSPTYCRVVNEDGETIGADMYSFGGGNLGDYVANCKSIAQLQQTSFVDNYFISEFNGEDYKDYLGEDGMPNERAREFVADHIISFLYINR